MEDPNADLRPNRENLSVDVLLVTATDVEGQTVIDLFRQETDTEFQRRFIGNKTYHDLGVVGGARVLMVQTEKGSVGPNGSLLNIQEAIEALSPAAIIMVGIAFGVDAQKQRIGDILISSQVWLSDPKRIGATETIARGDRASASARLVDKFQSGQLDWKGARIKFGLLLSGENLVDSIDFRNQLLKLEPEAIGGEMEGAGLYSAAQRAQKDWIIVKAICDWADGQKSIDKKRRQKRAAQNAVKFVIHVLGQGGFAQSKESHTTGKSPAARFQDGNVSNEKGQNEAFESRLWCNCRKNERANRRFVANPAPGIGRQPRFR